LEVGEGLLDRGQVDAGITRPIERHDGVAHPRRVLDVDPVGHVVLVKTVLHPPPLGAADYSLPKGGNQGKTGQKEKWEQADKPGSVAPAGVTRWGRQPFLSTPGYPGALATYPQARPSRPYGALPHHACLFGVAPDGGCLVSPLTLRPGLVSVALFVTSPCQGVTLHPALRSPDFPLYRVTAAIQRLPGRLPAASYALGLRF